LLNDLIQVCDPVFGFRLFHAESRYANVEEPDEEAYRVVSNIASIQTLVSLLKQTQAGSLEIVLFCLIPIVADGTLYQYLDKFVSVDRCPSEQKSIIRRASSAEWFEL
jgi:hypothetical protein